MHRYTLLLPALLACGPAWAQEATPAPGEPALEPTLSVPLASPEVVPVVVPASEADPADPAAAPADAAAEPTPDTPAVTPAPAGATAAPQAAPELRPAGVWEGDFNAGVSVSAGNTDGYSVNLGLDATYTRPDDKLSLVARFRESRALVETDGVVSSTITALQWRLGGRYDRDLAPTRFAFGGLEFSHDRALDLNLRSVLSTGLGRHLVKEEDDRWDVYAGLTWREDYYAGEGVVVDGELRRYYSTAETLFGEESTHHLARGASFRQKFVLYPGLLHDAGMRATLDAGLQVALNKTLSLSVTLQGRYDGQTQVQDRKYDLLLITGLSVRFGG